MNRPLVVKIGGELAETPAQRARLAGFAASIAARRPLVVIHGGGRAIDAELDRRGIAPMKVDGLRVTDAETLETVVAVLAGSANTALVAAFVAQGVPAVGLTGVDAGLGRAARAAAHRTTTGEDVDLGFVGDPADVDATLLGRLLAHGYVPVIASVGLDRASAPQAPGVLNVNADVMACRIAAALTGSDLVIAGGTAGVLDANGATMPALDVEGIGRAIASKTATAGMIAKLSACLTALMDGVASVRIIDGRTLDATHGLDAADGTTLVAVPAAARMAEPRLAGKR